MAFWRCGLDTFKVRSRKYLQNRKIERPGPLGFKGVVNKIVVGPKSYYADLYTFVDFSFL